ncbi:MAG: acetyltransferase [Oscillospiraceae bacterium]|jgi:sugar O-acyltransferase (sialic acid O-acetyltransferase NeuD family)|nr:acetyltransferase [Oscillospiraceae bacterium]
MALGTLLILGTGGHAQSVWEAARHQYRRILFLSNDPTILAAGEFCGCPAFYDAENNALALHEPFDAAIVAIGENYKRLALTGDLFDRNIPLATVIHPTASVSAAADVQPGSCILAQAAVNAFASMGRACIINTGAVVEHGCRLGAGVHLSPRAALGGNTTLGDCAWMCIGAVAAHNITIGEGSVIAANAAVVSAIPPRVLAAGVPARVKRHF